MRACVYYSEGFPGDSVGKEPACNVGAKRDISLIPGLGRTPGGRHGNLLQDSCLENPMDRATWWATLGSIGSLRVGHDGSNLTCPHIQKLV